MMPEYTNVSAHPLHIADKLVFPTSYVDLSAEQLKQPVVKGWVDRGLLKEGRVEVAAEVEQAEGFVAPGPQPALENGAPQPPKPAENIPAPPKSDPPKK